MFVDLETDRGERITVNSFSIVAYWTVKKNKVCVLLINDLSYTLNCSYEELCTKLNGSTACSDLKSLKS